MERPPYLVPRMKYRIRYRLDGQRKDREAVLRYMGGSQDKKDSHWDGRPDLGTQTFPWASIKAVAAVPVDTDIYTDRAPTRERE
jgi:hypothetical protein